MKSCLICNCLLKSKNFRTTNATINKYRVSRKLIFGIPGYFLWHSISSDSTDQLMTRPWEDWLLYWDNIRIMIILWWRPLNERLWNDYLSWACKQFWIEVLVQEYLFLHLQKLNQRYANWKKPDLVVSKSFSHFIQNSDWYIFYGPLMMSNDFWPLHPPPPNVLFFCVSF